MSPSILRLFSVVFLGGVLPLLGIYAVLMVASTPSPTGGVEPIVSTICYIAFTCIFGALITVAVNFSRQLGREARGEQQLP